MEWHPRQSVFASPNGPFGGEASPVVETGSAMHTVGTSGQSDNPPCPSHPAIRLPPHLTCPLCAQEARAAAYAASRARWLAVAREAAQRLATAGGGTFREAAD